MWIDKVKEAKKALGLSNRAISVETKGKLSERDVMRLLNGEFKKPFVDDVIALGAAVKLSPQQLFGDANSVVENASTIADIAEIKLTNCALSAENENLKNEITHKNEILKLKEELLDMYRNSKNLQDELLEMYRNKKGRK